MIAKRAIFFAQCAARQLRTALIIGWAGCHIAPAAAQQPVHLFEGPARVEFAGTPTQATSIRHFLQAMEVTTAVAATPILGGLEVMLPARLNAHYNSLPYGNCGLLNGIGASLYSALTGARFRYRSTSFHVATEIELGAEFRVLDTYTGTRLVSTEQPELFTIEQLERDAAVWTPARTGDRFLFEKVAPIDPSGPPVLHTVPTWRLPVLDDFVEALESSWADLRNIPDPDDAGTTAPAVFLRHFVGDRPWAHVDIGETGFATKTHAETVKGCTGMMARTLAEIARTWR